MRINPRTHLVPHRRPFQIEQCHRHALDRIDVRCLGKLAQVERDQCIARLRPGAANVRRSDVAGERTWAFNLDAVVDQTSLHTPQQFALEIVGSIE